MDSSRGSKLKNEKCLCEKSMEVVANIIRLSSFSIARKALGTTTTSGKASAKDLSVSGCDLYGDMVPEKEPLVHHHRHQLYGSKRSREPQSRANPTYVTKPVLSNGSNFHVIHEEKAHSVQKKEESVDRLASEYIRNIRKQLGCGL